MARIDPNANPAGKLTRVFVALTLADTSSAEEALTLKGITGDAIVVQCAIVLVLALSSTFERLAILANLSTLVLYATCCLATWQLRRRDVRAGGTPFRVPIPGLVIVLACLVIGWMLTSVTPAEWLALGIALAVASGLFLMRHK